MAIVHIMTVPQSLGFLRGQPTYMKARGLSPLAVTSPGAKLADFGRAEGVPVFPVAMARRISPLRDLISLHGLCAVIRQARPSLVHSHTPKGGLLGMIAAWMCGVPCRVYSIHGFPFLTARGWRRIMLWLTERISCALAHRVVSVSESIRQVAISEGVCRPGKIVVLGSGSSNGVDAESRFHPDQFSPERRQRERASLAIPVQALVVGFIGRVVRDKGIVELSLAWKQVSARYPDAHLVIVGDIEDQDPVPREVMDAFRVDPSVHLVGAVADPASWYAMFDLVVLPTYREGLPNVPLEAAAMALPVVATRVPGCTDAVRDGMTGTLVPARDASALAEAIARYLGDPVLRQRHGRAGRDWMLGAFRPEVMWEAVYQMYRQLLGRSRRSGP